MVSEKSVYAGKACVLRGGLMMTVTRQASREAYSSWVAGSPSSGGFLNERANDYPPFPFTVIG